MCGVSAEEVAVCAGWCAVCFDGGGLVYVPISQRVAYDLRNGIYDRLLRGADEASPAEDA